MRDDGLLADVRRWSRRRKVAVGVLALVVLAGVVDDEPTEAGEASVAAEAGGGQGEVNDRADGAAAAPALGAGRSGDAAASGETAAGSDPALATASKDETGVAPGAGSVPEPVGAPAGADVEDASGVQEPDRSARAAATTGVVVHVVDGDTVDLDDGTRVRLAITDTPEVHSGVEACGAEASAFTAKLVLDQSVTLRRPADAPATDGFGRTVAEVVRDDGTSLNVALVAAGYGTVDERFTSEDPDLAARLRAASASAATPPCAAGTTEQPQPLVAAAPPPSPGPDDRPPSPNDAPEEAAPPSPGGAPAEAAAPSDCHPAYVECLPVVADLNCSDIGHPVRLTGNADPYRLDGRSKSREDGIGCESS